MILLVHNNIDVCSIFNLKEGKAIKSDKESLNEVFFELAEVFPKEKIIWCHKSLETFINIEELEKCSDLFLKMCSFETSKNYYINKSIGFIDQSLFINVNKKVEFPTWLMSSDVGIITGSILVKFNKLLNNNLSFEELLNYIAKKGMEKGLLCYSNPFLLKNNYPIINKESILGSQLFLFIKSNYKYRWIWLYQLNQLIYNRRVFFTSYIKSLFIKKIILKIQLPVIEKHSIIFKTNPTIDVLIPTLGREKYLKDVLIDLSKQTLKPTRIIIIEQQSIKNTPSSLDYLKGENWPFEIDHTLIYQLGACNARNIALDKVKSEWVFFADDDIRMEPNFLEKSFQYIEVYHAKAVTLSCLQKGEKENLEKVIQWNSFGSGCSIVKSKCLKNIQFDMALEFGYGEDSDFGMQLRNNGVDILYVPFVNMLHLKAPIGGFRKEIVNDWSKDNILPKPSPTVMVSKLKNATKEQFKLYKTILFFKYYKVQKIKNPITYFRKFKKQWVRSIFWANRLIKKNINEF